MLRLWISRETSIPVREQLSAQLLLGILSRRLAPGERLPSVRELARRLRLHANTISGVYQDLAVRGWVVQRRGSGVFVSARNAPKMEHTAEAFARACIEDGLARGFTQDALLLAFASISQQPVIRHFLAADPDIEFSRVLAAEIREALGVPVASGSCQDVPALLNAGTCIIVNSAHLAQVSGLAGKAPVRCVELNSMQDVIEGLSRPTSPVLIGVVSRSESILRWSSTLLSALGFAPESVILRDPRQPHWKEGLAACGVVAADLISATLLPRTIEPIVFRLISERFLADLRQAVTLA